MPMSAPHVFIHHTCQLNRTCCTRAHTFGGLCMETPLTQRQISIQSIILSLSTAHTAHYIRPCDQLDITLRALHSACNHATHLKMLTYFRST